MTGVIATQDFWGGDVGLARRHAGGRREGVTVALGAVGGSPAVRVTAAVQFVLPAAGRAALSPYGGVGLAFVGVEGSRSAGYLALMLGVEGAPGRPLGWFAEAGVEGGVRVSAGLRWRRFSPASHLRKHEGRSPERPARLRSDPPPLN